MRVSIKWKPQDLWIGAYWERSLLGLTVWVCIVPCLPIKIAISADGKGAG